MFTFSTRCKACELKDTIIDGLQRDAVNLQSKCHIYHKSHAFMARQAELLRRDNPEIWQQYFSKKAKRFVSSKELKAQQEDAPA